MENPGSGPAFLHAPDRLLSIEVSHSWTLCQLWTTDSKCKVKHLRLTSSTALYLDSASESSIGANKDQKSSIATALQIRFSIG